MRIAVVALIALLVPACTARDAAQLVVVVSTDLAVPTALDAIEIRLRDAEGAIVEERALSLADRALPAGGVLGSFGVSPLDGDVTRSADLELGAVEGGVVLFRTRLKTRFVANAKLRVDVFLAASCVEAECAESLMCLRGECRPPVELDPTTLPPYEGDDPGPHDAGAPADAAPTDAGDAGFDAAADSGPTDASEPADVGARDAGLDAGPPACTVSSPFRVEPASGRELAAPSIQWNGAELGIAWIAFVPELVRQELAFARVAASGATRLDTGALRIESTHTGTTSRIGAPQLVWTGTDYGVVFEDTRVASEPQRGDVFLARFAPSASTPSVFVALASTAGYEDAPAVAWSGTTFGVAWRVDYGFGRFARFDGAGGPLAAAPADLGERSRLAVAFDPDRQEWPLVTTRWVAGSDNDLYLDRANASGQLTSTIPIPLSEATTGAVEPALVVAEGEYGVAWVERAPEPTPWHVQFATVAPGDGSRSAIVDVAEQRGFSDGPALAWRSDVGYLLAFRDGGELRVARIARDGALRVQSVTLADPAMSRPTLVADAAGFALAWADSRGVNVATITCP